MLIGHPERYTPTQLDAWIRSLVDASHPENRRLDYKASPGKNKREWAKDITSFANELGGVLLYGIPESQNTEKGPVPCRPYGIEPVPSLEQDLENVYSSAILPPLPDYKICPVPLSEYPGKVCYLVWTPESWVGPHMVSAYQDHRYYRRGEFRAIIMTERDVEERYRRRIELRSAAEQFMESKDAWHNLQAFPLNRPVTTLMVVPHLFIPNRIVFHEPAMQAWLQGLRGVSMWLPSMYGVRMEGGCDNDQEIVEMHRNGAVITHQYTSGEVDDKSKGFIIAYVREFHIWQRWLEVAGQLYQHIGYDGPVTIFAVLQTAEAKAYPAVPVGSYGPFILPYGGSSHRWSALLEREIKFSIESSAVDLALRPNKVLRKAADELCRAFGKWQADCFNEQDQLRQRW